MKNTKSLFSLILVISMLFLTTACGMHNDLGGESNSDLESNIDQSDIQSDIQNGFPDQNFNNDSSDESVKVEHIEGQGDLMKNDISRYSIVADKYNSLAIKAAKSLSSKLSDKGISLPLNDRSVYEILIGNNTSAETKAALEQLAKTDSHYIIQFSGKKIVIVAKTDLALSEACDLFFDTYIKDLKDKTIAAKDGTTTLGTAKNLATLSFNGIAQYEIVFGQVSQEVKNKTNELVTFMKSMCGVKSIKTGASYSAKKAQILIGPATFSETSAAIKSLKPNEYTITKSGNKIVVAGKSDTMTIGAIDAFIDAMNVAKSVNPTKGNFTLSISGAIKDSFSATLDAIPSFSGGTYSTTYPSGSGIKQLYYKSADASKINAYVARIEALGYIKVQDNSINGNRFVTCHSDKGLVHISYLNYNKSLTVILDSLSGAVYKGNEPAYTKVTETSLAVMSLDYDTTQEKIGSNYDASGMSYVITLEDGRYIVIDGGYGGAKDHHILFNYLKNNNKRKDGKIVIAAWIFTHDHSDHYGGFVDFSNTYGTRVTLEYYLMNCGDKSRYDQQPSGWLPGTSKDGGLPYYCLNKYFKTAKKIVPHTGQKITFCNTTFEIMCSQESHSPNKMEWVNDSSIILRMTANGVTTLFLADAEAQTTNLLNNMYGSTLKSDIMQIAHHGFSGGSTALYQKIAPKWTLWPTSQECFNQRTNGGGNGNAQAQNKWARQNSTCYVGDDNIEILTFVGGTSKISVTTCAPIKTQG